MRCRRWGGNRQSECGQPVDGVSPKAADTWPDVARPIECAVYASRVRSNAPYASAHRSPQPTRSAAGRDFAVNYRFLACGDVFTDGLRHAADTLGIEWSDASWDDPNLPARVSTFAPDLLFVVHGRRFAQRWRRRFNGYRTAVWLLDEPYEVDDTAGFFHVRSRVRQRLRHARSPSSRALSAGVSRPRGAPRRGRAETLRRGLHRRRESHT